ncbi:MAG: N-acetyltransferase [Proteobacteria bacterium]|nr:N-acetyltransferase [Pseudomonadota bacterium]
MEISIYKPNNADEIEQLFIKTFSDSEGRSEGEAIGSLVRDFMDNTDANDLYCFIATENEQIIGSIFFTRMIFESGINAFILSPAATHTDHQGKGVGQKLINFGLGTLKEAGVELAITYGDPNFYSKVGFSVITEKLVPAPLNLQYPGGWLAQSLVSDEIEPITGKSYCVEELNKPELW